MEVESVVCGEGLIFEVPGHEGCDDVGVCFVERVGGAVELFAFPVEPGPAPCVVVGVGQVADGCGDVACLEVCGD